MKPKRIVLVLVLFLSSFIWAFSSQSPTVYAAPTSDECYALNNTVYNSSIVQGPLNPNREQQEQCFNLGYCKKSASNSADKITCSDTVYKASDQYKAIQDALNNARILNAQVLPIAKIICGSPSTNEQLDQQYQVCLSGLKTAYTQCANNAETGGSPTEDEVVSAIAQCIKSWAATTYPTKNIQNTALLAAVKQGRGDGSAIANEIGDTKTEICAQKGKQYMPSASDADADGCAGTLSKTVCSGGALGWVLCPFISMMHDAIEVTAKLMDSLLRLNPLDNTTGGGSIYSLWRSILNIANIVLVLVFLLVIFSQATSLGLSSYGIKKMLPRIIAAAILMNLSFFICQVLVDLSNILGAGTAQLVQSATNGAGFSTVVSEQLDGVRKTVAVSVTLAIIVFFFLIPVLLSFLAVFFTIAARFALVILLVLVAPLAFAAWILPNTEKYFQKWWGLFFNLLMLYPIIMLLFAASIIASNAVGSTAP